MILKYFFALSIASFFFVGCKTNSKFITTAQLVENRVLDTLSVTASKLSTFKRPNYNPAATRTNDLLHTKLDISFDWENQYLNGEATLDLKPLFYPTNQVRLDAKGFDIHKIAMIGDNGEIPLKFTYENNKDLYINLDRTYTNSEEYRLFISYTAKPNELPIGGSNAITSDKGLYFINPLGKEVGKPKQIWTQGETESSSCWFPTIDRPNERCTQEMLITVNEKYKTLSNGELKKTVINNNGTRTDHWIMDLPHAPYLFAMIVGEFAVVSEKWNGKLLEYYVEKKYENDAREIYKNTPEMLTFFSEKLGIDYPWNKYSQVVVRDFVSGAMENTTAVIFGDFVQMTSRELIDHGDLNESIVAHEMMHHWFGDLVTCESWANLPLNESFANYSEYLWFEQKYGRDAADYIRKNQIEGYFNQAVIGGDKHPLIYFGYNDKEDMFDAHSYNKGGTILHMLRYVVGDEAFFASLNKYLKDNEFNTTEFHHLRLAFESVTGQDLNWFFNQWFLTAGHPNLEVSKSYNATDKILNVTVKQTQDLEESTVFILPFAIDVYTSETRMATRTNVIMTEQEQTFSIKVENTPIWVAVDAERVLLSKFQYKQSKEELVHQYNLSKRFQDRYDAIKNLRYLQNDNPTVTKVFKDALEDPFWVIREKAIDGILLEQNNKVLIEKIISIAQTDPRSHVRSAAIEKIGRLNNPNYLNVAKNAIDNDQSFKVITAALDAINSNDEASGIENAEKLMGLDNPILLNGIAVIFEKTGNKKYTDFYEQNWSKTDNYSRFTFFNSYATLLLNSNDKDLIKEKIAYLKSISTDRNVSQWGRYASSNALKKIRTYFFRLVEKEYNTIKKKIDETKDPNTNDVLEKLKKLQNNKSKAHFESTIDAVKTLKTDSINQIIKQIEGFYEENIYDLTTNAIKDIKNWEKNKMLLKLYGSW
ncbi:MAG: M1 family metallopeptidase [Saprospiraceae bacterium]|nr:M1 family metallopeptidase [Saprospiraceae bacterium]